MLPDSCYNCVFTMPLWTKPYASCFLYMLGFSQEYLENWFSRDKATLNGLSVQFKIRGVSSAYWMTLSSMLENLIPLISLQFIISIPRISTQRIKIYGGIGSPWRQPWVQSAVCSEHTETINHLFYQCIYADFFCKELELWLLQNVNIELASENKDICLCQKMNNNYVIMNL